MQSEYNNISKEQTKTATELAYAEVISYNRKNLERELQNESRQIEHRAQTQIIQNKKRNNVELKKIHEKFSFQKGLLDV